MFCEGFCGILVNIVLVLFGVLALHYVYLLWNSDYWKKRGVFCPDSKALFGNLPGQVNGKRNILYELDDLYQKFKGKHSCIGIFSFRQPRLVVFDPEVIKDIMVKHFKNFQGTELYGKIDRKSDPLFGKHSFFLIGDEWKTKRNEVSPAFTNSRMKATFPVTTKSSEKLIDYIRKQNIKSDHDGFDAKNLAARYTIDVVANSIYNVNPESFEDEESPILKKSSAFLAPSSNFRFISMINTLYPFLNKFLKHSFAQPGAEKFFIDLMNNAIEYREERNIKAIDFLEHLINLKKKKEISDLDMAGHGASFLVDGFETSSSAISSVFYNLAKNKHIQDKLRNEIKNAISSGEDFNYENVMNLEYLDQVWNESLRLNGPILYLHRYCNESVRIELPKEKELTVDKGTVVFIPIYSIHNDPEYYPNPEVFDPDRFSPENGGAKALMERGIFMPFGIGPRICVGNRFALTQSKVAIAEVVKNFEISINPKTPEKFEFNPQAFLLNLEGCSLDFKAI